VNTAKFGIPRTLYREASSGNRSVSTFSTTARPARSRATCATCGAAVRQGPHQAAQKSTSTGTLLSRTTSSNSPGFTSMGSAIAGSVALHAPHLPVSARCFAGIRFDFPHDGQLRMIAKVEPSTTNALAHTTNYDHFEHRRLASIPHEASNASPAFRAEIRDRSSLAHLVRVEDVVLRLHCRMARISAV
jgi:hypothetical protein